MELMIRWQCLRSLRRSMMIVTSMAFSLWKLMMTEHHVDMVLIVCQQLFTLRSKYRTFTVEIYWMKKRFCIGWSHNWKKMKSKMLQMRCSIEWLKKAVRWRCFSVSVNYSIQLLVWGSWPVIFLFIHFPDDNNDDKSQKVLEELENIDDECDALGITFVKIDNIDEAKEYGIDSVPSLLYFEKGIPTVYEGRLEDEESVLKWLEQQTTSDEIEDITDEMLDLILEKMPYVAVLFCKLICTFTLSSPPNPFSHVSILFSSVYCVLLLNHQLFSYSPFGLSTKWLKWPNKTNKKQQLIEWSKSNQLIYPILLSSTPLFSTRMFNTFSLSYPCSSILCVACANHLIIDLPPEYVLCSKIQFKTSFSIDIFRWILGLRVSYVFNCFSLCCISVAFSTFISNRNFYLGLLFLQPMKKKHKNKKYLSE